MVVEWVLILTMFSYRWDGGNAVASVPGFESRADCMAAANAWLAQAKNQYVSARALCTARSKAR